MKVIWHDFAAKVSIFAIKRTMEQEPLLKVTLPNLVDDEVMDI